MPTDPTLTALLHALRDPLLKLDPERPAHSALLAWKDRDCPMPEDPVKPYQRAEETPPGVYVERYSTVPGSHGTAYYPVELGPYSDRVTVLLATPNGQRYLVVADPRRHGALEIKGGSYGGTVLVRPRDSSAVEVYQAVSDTVPAFFRPGVGLVHQIPGWRVELSTGSRQDRRSVDAVAEYRDTAYAAAVARWRAEDLPGDPPELEGADARNTHVHRTMITRRGQD